MVRVRVGQLPGMAPSQHSTAGSSQSVFRKRIHSDGESSTKHHLESPSTKRSRREPIRRRLEHLDGGTSDTDVEEEHLTDEEEREDHSPPGEYDDADEEDTFDEKTDDNYDDEEDDEEDDGDASEDDEKDEEDASDDDADDEENASDSSSSSSDSEEGELGCHLADDTDKVLFEIFYKQLIRYEKSTVDVDDLNDDDGNESPFDGEDDEVDAKFSSLWDDAYGDGFDMGYLTLRNDPDEVTIALSREEFRDLKLENEPFFASAQQMDAYLYCRLNEFPESILRRVHRCSAYKLSLNLLPLKTWKGIGLKVFEESLDSELKPVDYNLIPLLHRMHWILVIVCGLGNSKINHPSIPYDTPCVLYLNSLDGIRAIAWEHAYIIAKVVARKAGRDLNYAMWHEIPSPQQENGFDCGFYVMRFVVDFLKNLNSPRPLAVHDLFHALASTHYFLDGEETTKKVTKIVRKVRQQLKGFTGSIDKDQRQWMLEFSEGKQCKIDPVSQENMPLGGSVYLDMKYTIVSVSLADSI